MSTKGTCGQFTCNCASEMCAEHFKPLDCGSELLFCPPVAVGPSPRCRRHTDIVTDYRALLWPIGSRLCFWATDP
ncbi:uncharacterized [Tachysurus ichikawai]